MYQNAELQKNLLPEIKKAFATLKDADKTDDKRDVRPLMSLLMRIVSASPRLRGHITTRRTGVSSFNWRIKTDDPAKQKLADESQARLKKIIKSILKYHTDTPAYGAMLLQIKWELMNGANVPRLVKRFQPTEFEKYG